MEVRDAYLADLQGILEIYNEVVTNSTAVWTDGSDDLANRRRWFESRQGRGFSVLVAVEDGNIVGYSSFGEFRAWSGYRHTVEHSIYVRADRRRTGVGRALLSALVERARAYGAHAMIGGIEAGNGGSLALHQRLGFREVARMPEVGCKFGRWLDLVLMQLLLDSCQSPRRQFPKVGAGLAVWWKKSPAIERALFPEWRRRLAGVFSDHSVHCC